MTSPRPPEQRRKTPVEINLIPKAKPQRALTVSTFNVVLVVLVVALAYLVFPSHAVPNLYRLYDDHQDAAAEWDDFLAGKEAELARLVTISAQTRALQEQVDELKKLLDDIDVSGGVIANNAVAWSMVLTEVDSVAPPGVNITDITYSSEVTIEGSANDNFDVSDFVSALEETGLFSSVVISELTCEPPPTPTPTPTPTPRPTPTPTPTRTPTPTPKPPCTFTITVVLEGGNG